MRLSCSVIVAATLAVGCSHPAYECVSSAQCLDHGDQGRCEPQGFCSFPDPACPSGDRFEPNAGNNLGSTCVPENNDVPDAGVCGGVGMACCPGDTCGGNAFCTGGTCAQCVTDVALGLLHSCFLKYDGTVWCTGLNDRGQLGNGGMATIPTAMFSQVRDSTGAAITDATAIGVGHFTSCAIRSGGALWCWGGNDQCTNGGQVGDGTTNDRDHAVEVIRESDDQPLTNIVEVHGAYCQTCARDGDGGVWCWGDNGSNRLGDGTTVSHAQAVPVRAAAGGQPFTGAIELSVGDGQGCVRKANNEVWCWGLNFAGQVGNGTKVDQPVPAMITTATSMAAGRYHTCAVNADGTIDCWGQGNQGRLGNGTGDKDAGDALDQPTPAPVLTSLGGAPFDGVASVAAGAVTCAVMTNKDLYCWGVNLYGQTGTGVGSYLPAPVLDGEARPLHNVDRVVAQFTRSCAFLTDGQLVCWGRNSEGQLGDGTFTNRGLATPVKLSCP